MLDAVSNKTNHTKNNNTENRQTRRVHVNAFGHAIPDLPAAKKAESKKML